MGEGAAAKAWCLQPNRLLRVALFVSIVCALGCGRRGDPVPPGVRLPGPPGDVRLSAPDGVLTLSWRAPREDTGGKPLKGVTGYRVTREAWPPGSEACESCPSEGEAVETLDSQDRRARGLPETSWVDREVHSGWSYRYGVRAVDERGRPGALSRPAQITWIPVPPPSATAVAGDTLARVLLAAQPWPAGLTPLAVRVYGPSGELLAEGPPEVRELPVSGLEDGKTYVLSVRREAQTSEAWEVESPGAEVSVAPRDTTPPPPPSQFVALATGQGVSLLWQPAGPEPYASVTVLRSEGGGPPRELARLPGDATEYLDTAVQPGRTYGYSLQVADAAGNVSLPTREERVRIR